jgi:hypothetical protein
MQASGSGPRLSGEKGPIYPFVLLLRNTVFDSFKLMTASPLEIDFKVGRKKWSEKVPSLQGKEAWLNPEPQEREEETEKAV